MPNANWLTRPLAAACFTLAVALVPVAFAVRHFQRAAAATDAAIFSTASATAEEKLRLITVRHLSWLNVFRNRFNAARLPTPDAFDRELPDYVWRNRPPHWQALAFADVEKVRWVRGDAPLSVGDAIAEPLRSLFAEMSRDAERQLAWGVPWAGQRHCVAMSLPGGGFLLGWIDLAAVCADPNVELAGQPGALVVSLAGGAGRVVEIGEGRMKWSASIARGPRYAELLAQPSGRTTLAAGALTALLLATLAGLAAKARLDSQRTHALRTALDAEREVGRLRGQFVSSVSHEFRTPLSVILSSADLLGSYGPRLDPARSGEAIAQIQDSAKRLAGMVDEILLLSRLESGRIAPRAEEVDVAELCASAAREVATAAHERCPIAVAAAGTARLDAALLRGVLVNLLTNAVKFSAPGSPVRLAAERRGDGLVFTVSDRGIGIPAGDLAQVGEAFHRAANVGDAPGTGLGLAIVRRTAAVLGGTFTIASEQGRGTVATFTLPAA